VLFSERALCIFAPTSFEKEAWYTALSRACDPAPPAPAPPPAAPPSAQPLHGAALDAAYTAFLCQAEAAMRAAAAAADAAAAASASASASAPSAAAGGADGGVAVGVGVLNLASARYFFDLQRNPRAAEALAARLQLQLSRVDTPPFMSRLRVARLVLPPGGAPPRAARLALCADDAHPALRGAAQRRGPSPAYEVRACARARHLHCSIASSKTQRCASHAERAPAADGDYLHGWRPD
jgi:hypothetical protein